MRNCLSLFLLQKGWQQHQCQHFFKKFIYCLEEDDNNVCCHCLLLVFRRWKKTTIVTHHHYGVFFQEERRQVVWISLYLFLFVVVKKTTTTISVWCVIEFRHLSMHLHFTCNPYQLWGLGIVWILSAHWVWHFDIIDMFWLWLNIFPSSWSWFHCRIIAVKE
jgi:hypothetical protein